MKLILALFAVQFAVALAQSYLDTNKLPGDNYSERSRRFVVMNRYPQYDVKLYANEANHSGFVIYGEGYGPGNFQQHTAVRTTPRIVTPKYPAFTTKSGFNGSPPHFTTLDTSKVSKKTFGSTSINDKNTASTTPWRVTTKNPAFTTKSTFNGYPPHFITTKPPTVTFGSTKTNEKKTGSTTPKHKKPVSYLPPPVDCALCSQFCSAKFY